MLADVTDLEPVSAVMVTDLGSEMISRCSRAHCYAPATLSSDPAPIVPLCEEHLNEWQKRVGRGFTVALKGSVPG